MKQRRTRLGIATRNAADWEEAALDVIAESGIAAVTIPDLAGRLGVTKGSFYWHFTGLDDLTTRAVQRWENADRSTLEEIRQIKDPKQRIAALFAEVVAEERAPALYLALALAPSRRFAATLARVSARRLRVLTELYQEIGMTRGAAHHQALLAYMTYLGWLHLRNSKSANLSSQADLTAYMTHVQRVLFAFP